MAHTKIISPYGWDFDDPIVAPVKLGADGRFYGPTDRRAFIKRASAASQIFLPMIESGQVKFAADEMPIHLIALGAKEAYGPNRNGDAFTEAMLKASHDTFVKFGRWFRNHKNKPHEGNPHYGIVKASAYNPIMRRVELLIGLNKTKQAADRNGGLIADKELEKIARGEDIPVSMACRVPYDVCSGCGNKARTRDEYCKTASCKYGGCYDNLTKLVKTAGDVHLLHVENPNPTFFDISNVFRPADRIAYGGVADWMMKAASDTWDGRYESCGSKMASDLGISAPLAVVLSQDNMMPGEWRPYLAAQIKLAYGLAAVDHSDSQAVHPETKRAFAADVQPDIPLEELDLTSDKPEKVAAALGALADKKIILPLRDFSRMTKRAELADAAGECLRGVYQRMIDDGSLERRLTHNQFAPAEKLAAFKHRRWAERNAQTYSLEKAAVHHRCLQSVARGVRASDSKTVFWNEKKAHDVPQAEELARDYACYKAAALRRIAEIDSEFPLTARMAICQNSVI